MKKKGFTLIELLAVIAILAILVIVAVPNVLNMFQDAKKGTFVTQAQNIFKSAENAYLADQLDSATTGARTYCKGSAGSGSDTALDLSGNKSVYYKIVTDASGYVTSFVVTDTAMSISLMVVLHL
jgi:prepilin-type N-terminal cleavage/methylation domain-containing protein